MFHLPGCRAALGSRDWVFAVLLTATTTSGCTAWVLCAFLFLWSNFAEAKRAWKSPRGCSQVRQYRGPLSPRIAWRLAKNRSRHAIELTGLKSIYSQIPNALSSKNQRLVFRDVGILFIRRSACAR